jgi:tetratricopeptide (TPR) repeat protein
VTKAELDKIKTPSSKAPIVTPNRSSAPVGNYSPNQSYDQETGTPSQSRSARKAAARMAKPPSKMEQLFQTPGSKVLALAAGSLFIGFSMALGFFAISQKSGPSNKSEQAVPGIQTQQEQPTQPGQTAQSGDGTSSDALSTNAREALAKGDYKTALENLHKLIALSPNSPQAQEKLALANYCQADYKGALDKLNAFITKHPKSVEALIDRGAVYYKQGNSKQAQRDYDMVLAIEPGNACALLGQSMCKLQRGEREDALRTLVRLVAQEPDFAPAYHPLAEIYLDQRDYALAVEMLSRGIKLAPEDDSLLALRARAYFLSDDKENAVKDWEEASKLKPDNADYKHDLDVAKKH